MTIPIPLTITITAAIAFGALVVHIWHYPVLVELRKDRDEWQLEAAGLKAEIVALECAIGFHNSREARRVAQCRAAAIKAREAKAAIEKARKAYTAETARQLQSGKARDNAKDIDAALNVRKAGRVK